MSLLRWLTDSNPQPHSPKPDTLPTELSRSTCQYSLFRCRRSLDGCILRCPKMVEWSRQKAWPLNTSDGYWRVSLRLTNNWLKWLERYIDWSITCCGCNKFWENISSSKDWWIRPLVLWGSWSRFFLKLAMELNPRKGKYMTQLVCIILTVTHFYWTIYGKIWKTLQRVVFKYRSLHPFGAT